MSSKHQMTHSLDVRHRDVERSCLKFPKETMMAIGSMFGGGGAKVLGKMRFINPTFQCPCKCIIFGNRMRYSPGRLSGNGWRLALLGNTM